MEAQFEKCTIQKCYTNCKLGCSHPSYHEQPCERCIYLQTPAYLHARIYQMHIWCTVLWTKYLNSKLRFLAGPGASGLGPGPTQLVSLTRAKAECSAGRDMGSIQGTPALSPPCTSERSTRATSSALANRKEMP